MRRTALSVLPVGNSPPSEIRMFAYGETETSRGPFVLTPERAQQIVQDWQAQGNDLSADYEHGMLNAIAGTGDPVPSSAAFRLESREDGLWAVDIRWTQKAAAHIEAGEYRHFSPLFEFNPDTREILKFVNFALTNVPAIKNQPALMALSMSLTDLSGLITSAIRNQFGERVSVQQVFTDYVVFDVWLDQTGWTTFRVGYTLNGDQITLDDTATQARQAYLDVPNGATMKKILIALSSLPLLSNLGTLQTEDDAVRGIAALSEFAQKAQALTGAASPDAALGVLSAWQQSHNQVAALSARVESMEAAEKTRVIEQAIKDRKLAPKQREWAQSQSTAALSAFLATAPRILGPEIPDELQPHSDLTVEKFMALSGVEKAQIYQENPTKYTELVALSKGKA